MTTFEAKKGFALSQIRTLSQISVNPDWQDSLPQHESSDLPKATVEAVLQKVNQALRRHQQMVYSSMAVDHVSEQIDTLYFQSQSRNRNGDAESEEAGVLTGRLDLTNAKNIELLPESWPSPSEGTEEEREKYRELVGRISSMSAGLENIRKRHSDLLAIRRKLAPLEDSEKSIQPNLVGKDSEVVAELKKMRMLAAKLANAMEADKERLRREAERMNVNMEV